MQRVEELASGIGVELRGLEAHAFEGRAVRISDDLVALRQEAKAFADFDIGGWRLNHPIGKMIQFQEVLFNEVPDAGAAATEAEAESASWLRVGEAVEVLMTDSELYGSRYVARVLALEEGRSRAQLEFVEFFEDEEGTVPLTEWASSAPLRPLPPAALGPWHARLRVGSPCELCHEGGWWEAVVVDRGVRLEGGEEGFSVRAALFPAIKYDAAA